jgi:outer membrane protein W
MFEPKERLTMSKTRAFFLTLCAVAGAFGAASAQAADSEVKHFKFFVGPVYAAPLEEDNVSFGGVTDSLAATDNFGWNAGFEWRFTKLLGAELDYSNTNEDLEFGGVRIGDTNFSPVTVTLNFHFGGPKWDFYAGPSYAYINWSDIQLDDGTEVSTNTGHGWGAQVGTDWYPWEHFGFYAGLRYLDSNLDIDNGPSTSQNALVARLGVAARF